MDDKVYLWDLYDESAKKAFENKAISKNPFYDLSQIPSQKMRNEVRAFIQWRSTKVCPKSLYLDIKYHKRICRFFSECTSEKNSLKDRNVNAWIKKFKAWLFKEGVPIYEQVKRFNGTIYTMQIRDINYLKQLVLFTQPDNRKKAEKDVWKLDKLDIEYRANPIKRARRLIFTGIPQDGIRQEVRKGIYLKLQSEAITCIQMEMTAIRRLSRYLADRFPQIDSCRELTREIIEEYLIYLKTEATETKHYHADLNRLRSLLESTGKMCEYENLAGLFLTRDVPPTPKAKFTVYSDNELKRLNREIVNLDKQIARLMIIHQMLGTRISDTLTLAPDCLSEKNGEIIIRIRQMKTKPYEKPISAELAALIHKSIYYTHERYGDVPYIFINPKDLTVPIAYSTVRSRVLGMIYKKDLRDDNGNLFGFGTHIYRHLYGTKLTEMHLDDWTIAKMLGHSSVRSVKYYRKMSNQLLADETRKARQRLSAMILENLDGWENEYEQIRKNAGM